MNSRLHFLAHAAPLLLVIFIDSIGLGLIFPVLNGLIFNPSSHFLSGEFSSPFMRNLVYGSIVGVFMLCWFFGAAILGDLSDKIGRKKSLLICLFGAFLSYVISAISISVSSLSLMLVARIINGLTSGSQAIAQAAVIDMSHSEQRARNMSYMFLALSLGFILGPLLGGVLADNRLVSWFTFSTPFYFAATLAFINMILLMLLFSDHTVAKTKKISIRFSSAVDLFVSAFKHSKVRKLSIIYSIYIFGWASFYSFSSPYLMKTYQFTPTQVSIFMGLMGVGFCIGSGFLVELLGKWFSTRQLFSYGSFVTGIACLLFVLIFNPLLGMILAIPIGALVAASGPAVTTLFSDQVDANSQGWVMGVMGSIMALIWAINGIIIGAPSSWGASIPIYAAALFLILSAFLISCFLKHE